MNDIKLYNDNCFNIFPKIKDKTIDLFILDLPYGQTACAWDTCIDLDKMWIEIKRIMKPSAILCFFCTTKFGYTLIKSNEKWFKYDLIWQKSRKVGFLSANKRQLRNHENIYVFNNDNNDDIELKQKHQIRQNKGNIELRKYAEKVKEYINKTKTNIVKECGQGLDHFLRISSSQFALPIEKNYKKLIELYKIDKMKGFLKYKDMVEKWEIIKGLPAIPHTYNPQKTEGTPYKNGAIPNDDNVYGTSREKGTITKTDRHPTSIIEHENIYVFKDKQGTYHPQKIEGEPYTVKNKPIYKGYGKQQIIDVENKGDRHPTSIIENTILKYNNPYKTIHRTEKPIGLLEYLIKTYSNEGDTVMDFTAGSLSCGVAAFNTKRKFIGVEMDKEIFNLGLTRIKEHTNSATR